MGNSLGSIRHQYNQFGYITANIKLPHYTNYNIMKGSWYIYPVIDTLEFWDGYPDGYTYCYQKIKEKY